MPARQITGWTRKGPGTFTSDEFGSDDQTPPIPVSKAFNKMIPSAEVVPSVKNFASYLDLQFTEIHSALSAKGREQETLQLKEELFSVLLRWEQAAASELCPVAPLPGANAEKLVTDLPAVPEKTEEVTVGDKIVRSETSLRGAQMEQAKLECGTEEEDTDFALVPISADEAPDDDWSSPQSFDNWCAARTKLAPCARPVDYQKMYQSEHAIVQKQKAEILRLHNVRDRLLSRIDLLSQELSGHKRHPEQAVRQHDMDEQCSDVSLQRALLHERQMTAAEKLFSGIGYTLQLSNESVGLKPTTASAKK